MEQLLISVNKIFDQHLPNMQTYILKFEPFTSLLNGEEAEAVSQFIHNTKDMEIFEISRKIDSIRKVRLDIEQLDLNADLGLFHIDCSQLNKFLAQSTQDHGLFLVNLTLKPNLALNLTLNLNLNLTINQTLNLTLILNFNLKAVGNSKPNPAQDLENQIVLDQLEKNRDLNRQVNRDYEEIGRRLSKEPNNTEELVDTISYMKNVIKIEKDALSKRVQLSGIRLEFLVLYADLQEEDFLLNSNVFGQPEFRFYNLTLTLRYNFVTLLSSQIYMSRLCF